MNVVRVQFHESYFRDVVISLNSRWGKRKPQPHLAWLYVLICSHPLHWLFGFCTSLWTTKTKPIVQLTIKGSA